VPGVSRADSVPNLTRRFAGWLAEREEVRERLRQLEEQLRQVPEKTRKPGPTPTAPRGAIPDKPVWESAWSVPLHSFNGGHRE
jgi:hypothetical protein